MSRLLPYETILKAREGDPDAIDTILSHYAGYIRYCSKVQCGKMHRLRCVSKNLPYTFFRNCFHKQTKSAIIISKKI